MTHISMKEIRDSLPEEKNRADSLWTRYILRPLSVPVAWLCLRWGLRANTVSYLSALICVFAALLFGSASLGGAIIGALLLICLLFLIVPMETWREPPVLPDPMVHGPMQSADMWPMLRSC